MVATLMAKTDANTNKNALKNEVSLAENRDDVL
jgi:hypothetical protein